MDFSKINYEAKNNSFVIRYDIKAIKTPAGNEMIAPSEIMAKAVVEEWQKLDKEINWSLLPISNYLSAIIDNKESLNKWCDDIISFAKNDLLCYLASHPKELKETQEKKWLPLVEKINQELDINFKTTFGIIPIVQDEITLEKVKDIVTKLNIFQIFTLRNFTGILGSFILGYSLFNNWIDKNEAFNLSLIDEEWQEDHWGQDEESTKRRQEIREELFNASLIHNLIG